MKVSTPTFQPMVHEASGSDNKEESGKKGTLVDDKEKVTKDGDCETLANESVKEDLIENTQNKEKKLWINIISGNRLPTNRMVIKYKAPKIVEGEVEVEIKIMDI